MIFRQDAIDNKRNYWSGRSLLISGIPVWIIVTFTLLFFTLLMVIIIFGSYHRRVQISGELISVPRAVTVFSSQQGYVVNQFVNVGDKVKKGQPLYQIDISRTTTSGIVSQNQKASIEKQIGAIENIILRIKENKKVTVSNLNEQKLSYETALQHSAEILKKSQVGLSIMKKNMENYRLYLHQGLVNKDQFTGQMAQYYQQQNDLLGISSQNEQNALQVITLQSTIQTQAADYDNQIYQLEIQKNDLARQLADADASGTLVVTSPVEGLVDSLSVTQGQMINVGDSLLQIIPGEASHYVLVLWIPSHAAPYISIGDKVNIRYDAFPAEKFGQFPGKILSISGTPASQQEMATYPAAPPKTPDIPQTWYKVIVLPENSFFSYQGRRLDAESGMKATSTLFLEKRRLYQWILSPLYDIRNSAGGPVDGK